MTNRRKNLRIRVIATTLLLSILLSMFPFEIIANAEDWLVPNGKDLANVVVLHDGAEKASIVLEENGKETLTALITDLQFDSRAWQIRTPEGEQWISIYNRSGDTLDVTYALVSSMLDQNGRAYIRHTVWSDGKAYSSEPVTIELSYSASVYSFYRSPNLVTASKTVALANANETEENQLVTIVINYIFDNGGIAFEPYGASIAKGSAF